MDGGDTYQTNSTPRRIRGRARAYPAASICADLPLENKRTYEIDFEAVELKFTLLCWWISKGDLVVDRARRTRAGYLRIEIRARVAAFHIPQPRRSNALIDKGN